VRMDLTLLYIDPNVAAIIEGTIMAAVVMFGAVLATRGRKT
jgi:ribose transport system permease protein